jgi:hypothetical protein
MGNHEEVESLFGLFTVGLIDDLLRLLGGYPSVSPHCAEQVSGDGSGCRHFCQEAEFNRGRLPPTRHGDQRIAAPFAERFLFRIGGRLEALKGRFIHPYGDMPDAIQAIPLTPVNLLIWQRLAI